MQGSSSDTKKKNPVGFAEVAPDSTAIAHTAGINPGRDGVDVVDDLLEEKRKAANQDYGKKLPHSDTTKPVGKPRATDFAEIHPPDTPSSTQAAGINRRSYDVDAVDNLLEEKRNVSKGGHGNMAGSTSSIPDSSSAPPPTSVHVDQLEDVLLSEQKAKAAAAGQEKATVPGAVASQTGRKGKGFSNNETDNVTLGAFSVQGPEADDAAREDHTTGVGDTYFNVQERQEKPRAVDTPGTTSPDSPSDPLVHAYLVTDTPPPPSHSIDQAGSSSPPQEAADSILPVHAKAVPYKPWYKRRPLMIALVGLLLLIAGAIAMAVTLTKDDSTTTTTTVVASESPTSSPAPTAIAAVTIVMQLGEGPEQVGWSLECDDEMIMNAPQGTYAFLPIGILIPSYRLEWTALVTLGSECVYTITDAGGEGLIGGFFEIFYGDDTAIIDNRLRGGLPLGPFNQYTFEAVPPVSIPPTGTTDTPTASPVQEPPTSGEEMCTVCQDGSPVPDAEAFLLDNTMTCGEADESANQVAKNSTRCLEFQQLAAECGCTNFCDSICPDGSDLGESVEDKVVRIDFRGPTTCGDIDTQVMARNSSIDDCLSANFLGESVCDCPPTGDFCKICQSGEVPENLTKQIIPGVACGDISGIAYSLLRSNPAFSFICPACLSIGEYCGCPPPAQDPRVFCRLCGDKLLPDTDRIVYSPLLEMNTTCFHIEFHSNLGIMPNGTTSVIPDCSVVQEQSSVECCG